MTIKGKVLDIRFVKIKSIEPVAEYLAGLIGRHLSAGERVLWLATGGSSIAVCATVSKILRKKDLSNLVVSLTDERYGELGHPDSNWQQLEDAGFKLSGATLLPVLTGNAMEATVNGFGAVLEREFTRADYRVGLFGIGADGHTAGLLPRSRVVRTQGFAAGYDAGQYRRITMTAPAMRRLDEAVVYAVGEAKHPVLDELERPKELNEQPAQALRSVRRLTIFNDYKGEEL